MYGYVCMSMCYGVVCIAVHVYAYNYIYPYFYI